MRRPTGRVFEGRREVKRCECYMRRDGYVVVCARCTFAAWRRLKQYVR